MISALAYRSNQQGPSLDVTRKSALLMATDLFTDGTRISTVKWMESAACRGGCWHCSFSILRTSARVLVAFVGILKFARDDAGAAEIGPAHALQKSF